jgi:hydrogenase maturation protease
MSTIALIGSGNAFFKDEGIGLYAAKYLKENYDFAPPVEVVDGGTLGFRLMPLLQEFDKVVIINTASDAAAAPGTISVRSCDEFLAGSRIKKTANEVEIAEMLQICSLTDKMAETVIVSIVPEDIMSVEVGMTEPLRAAWPTYIETVLTQLKAFGVECKKREETVGLETVLQIFAAPSIEHARGF